MTPLGVALMPPPHPVLVAPLTHEQNEILDDWADALESGDYTQGRSVLADHAVDGTWKHCCLGVLCEVLEKRNLLPEGWVWNGLSVVDTLNGNVWSAVPPSAVMRVAFGAANDAAETRSRFADMFARANDAYGKSFADIAQEIRNRTFFASLMDAPASPA